MYNEDCMELMKRYKDNHFELAIVDPPYGININNNMGRRKGQKHSGHKKVLWDSAVPSKQYFTELFRVSKNQIIWGGNYMTNFLYPSPCWLLWDKKFSDKISFAQYEMAWTSFNTSAKKYDKNANQGDKIHPTQKPVALYKWILNNYAKEGNKILDTHGGSGSICIACYDLKYDLVWTELDTEYYEAAKERFEKHIAQLQLF